MEPPDSDRLNNVANARMVVATLVAAMTFAAGFSVPGGYNDSEPHVGIATLLNKPMYDIFVICNTVAMYSSIITVVILLWTHVNDSYAGLHALRNAKLPLLIALATMSVAFMTGVYVTISKRTWIAVVVLSVGITAFFVILSLYIALLVPLKSNCPLLQLLCDYIIKAGISISSSGTVGWAIIPNFLACFGKPDNKPKQPGRGSEERSTAASAASPRRRGEGSNSRVRRLPPSRPRSRAVNSILMTKQRSSSSPPRQRMEMEPPPPRQRSEVMPSMAPSNSPPRPGRHRAM